jgi:hypothetical protein
MSDWKGFERLAERIARDLDPEAKITGDDYLPGRISETQRQIDVSMVTFRREVSEADGTSSRGANKTSHSRNAITRTETGTHRARRGIAQASC